MTGVNMRERYIGLTNEAAVRLGVDPFEFRDKLTGKDFYAAMSLLDTLDPESAKEEFQKNYGHLFKKLG
jgi:hypothetical protein